MLVATQHWNVSQGCGFCCQTFIQKSPKNIYISYSCNIYQFQGWITIYLNCHT